MRHPPKGRSAARGPRGPAVGAEGDPTAGNRLPLRESGRGDGMSGHLYSWEVRRPGSRRAGPGGVTADRQRALEDLTEALTGEQPGAWGAVWSVRLSGGRAVEYDYTGLIAQGLHDPHSGAITVEAS